MIGEILQQQHVRCYMNVTNFDMLRESNQIFYLFWISIRITIFKSKE